MNTAFTGAFLRDVRKLPDDAIREHVRTAILAVEAAPDLRSISNLKKLSCHGLALDGSASTCRFRSFWNTKLCSCDQKCGFQFPRRD